METKNTNLEYIYINYPNPVIEFSMLFYDHIDFGNIFKIFICIPANNICIKVK